MLSRVTAATLVRWPPVTRSQSIKTEFGWIIYMIISSSGYFIDSINLNLQNARWHMAFQTTLIESYLNVSTMYLINN